jgi:hypothetical protein
MLSQAGAEHGSVEASEHDGASAPLSTVGIALASLAQGFSIVPQLPGGKHPCVRRKMYPTCHPTPGVATLAKLKPWHLKNWNTRCPPYTDLRLSVNRPLLPGYWANNLVTFDQREQLVGHGPVCPRTVPSSADGAAAIARRRALQEKVHELSPRPPALSLHTAW